MIVKVGASPTKKKIEIEEDKFKAICYLKRGYLNRYKPLLTAIRNAAYVGQDEYPDTPSDAFELMVQRSGAFTTQLGGGGRGRGSGCGHGYGERGFNFAM